jgi:hypothetical protein
VPTLQLYVGRDTQPDVLLPAAWEGRRRQRRSSVDSTNAMLPVASHTVILGPCRIVIERKPGMACTAAKKAAGDLITERDEST